MADQNEGNTEWWRADDRIVGLGPPPWDLASGEGWPTEGYDGPIGTVYVDGGDIDPMAGHTREEWMHLAEVMIDRWAEFRRVIAALPEG